MAYTGADLYRDLQIRTYQGGAGAYLDIDRANYVINTSAIPKLIEENYALLSIQKNTDEISPCIKTNKLFIPKNNKVLLKPLVISSAQIQANPNITFNREHNLSAGTPIVITGVTGITGTITTYTLVDAYTINITGYTSTGSYVANSGYAVSSGYIIDDYYHLLAIKHRYIENLNQSIVSVLNNSKKTVITIGANNNIRSGEYLEFASFGGLTIGSKYVRKTSYNKMELFDDEYLAIPFIVSGTYTSGGVIKRNNERFALPLNSNQKIDVYKSTAYYPLSECNDNRLSIECYNKKGNVDASITQTYFVVDYVREYTPIDVEDVTYDITQDFNANFIDKIIEYATLKFLAMTSSAEDVQITEIIGGAK